jgi:hypothetical protein
MGGGEVEMERCFSRRRPVRNSYTVSNRRTADVIGTTETKTDRLV